LNGLQTWRRHSGRAYDTDRYVRHRTDDRPNFSASSSTRGKEAASRSKQRQLDVEAIVRARLVRSEVPRLGPAGLYLAMPWPKVMIGPLLDFMFNEITHARFGAMLLFSLVTTQLAVLAVTQYLHRGQAHRPVEFRTALTHCFRF